MNPRTWVPKASTLHLDHRSRFKTTSGAAVLLYTLQYIYCLFCLSEAANYRSAEEQYLHRSIKLSFNSVLPQPTAKATYPAVLP